MFELPLVLVLIPALPLAGALVTAVLGPMLLKDKSHLPVLAGVALSLLASLILVYRVAELPSTANPPHARTAAAVRVYQLWQWAVVGDAQEAPAASRLGHVGGQGGMVDFSVDVALRADSLTALMLVTVTFVSLLVVIYSVGYMHGDRGYTRFFVYIGLFVFSMTMLVSVTNFVMLYVFWEAVGLCSYLLIGFWYTKPEAAAAGKKAFLVNRIGDFGFALGIFLLWTTYGTLNFHDSADVAGILGQARLSHNAFIGGAIGTAIPLLLMLGACGKSAQFPLHVWLPDAMEGPTPVSALIHAATMVTAGVYMVVRCAPLFFASETAQHLVAFIGGFTALLAGLIAITQTDLKRVLAYSTVSQLGFMFLALGTGSRVGLIAAMFHLFTHAFFKALLFLGAGSVMHAMGNVIDMRFFGGLRRLMPVTCVTFFIGSLALAGLPPLSGFWSKDMILGVLHERAAAASANTALVAGVNLYTLLFWSAAITAFLTAFYTFRAFFMTFCGRERIPPEAGHQAHESPRLMTVPLIVLSVFALAIGWIMHATHWLADFLWLTPSIAAGGPEKLAPHALHLNIAFLGSTVAVAGIALAGFLYLGDKSRAQRLAHSMGAFYRASRDKFLCDEIYMAMFVWPLRIIAYVLDFLDRYLIDQFVNLVGRLPAMFGSVFRSLQVGLLQSYALAMALGLLILVGTLVLLR